MPDDVLTFKVENARLLFKNFTGRASSMNTAGNRNFCVVLDPETAAAMIEDGWHVKYLDPREEGDEPTPYIQVTVGYKIRPPRITLITSTGRTQLDESTVEVLDYANMKMVDLIARASYWTVGDKSGIKAYLQTMFVTIEEDDLEKKYAIAGEPYVGEVGED